MSSFSSDQLAFLNLRGFADVVISEDSELLAYDCKQVFNFYSTVMNECPMQGPKEFFYKIFLGFFLLVF